MIERWYRKLMAQGLVKNPAIIVATKDSPRGLTKEEIQSGLDASKEKGEPAFVNWEFDANKN